MGKQDLFRFVLSFISMAAIYLHLAFLVLGLIQAVYIKEFKIKDLLIISCIIIMISYLMMWASSYYVSEDARTLRFFIRVILRYGIIASGFFYAWIMTLRSRTFFKGVGQKIFRNSLLLYGLVYFYYFIAVTGSLYDRAFFISFFFGYFELVLISSIGLGMVMWLLEDERERLDKINKEMDSFLYSTSHDLRSPIASILGVINISRMRGEEENAGKYLSIIEERVKKLDAVIDDILKLSKSKNTSLKYERINFSKLLNEVIEDVKFNENAGAIKLVYKDDNNNLFKSDYNQVKLVLANLISNAVKYHNTNQEKPYVKIVFKRIGNAVQIIVEDNGKGIPSKALPKIFDMFYRASTDTSGTGLGLYIVKEALAKIDGSIYVISREGIGSTFTVVLAKA